MVNTSWSRFSKEELQELEYSSKLRISPSIIAMSLRKPVAVVLNKLRDLGLRRKKGYKEYDPDTNEWG